MKKSLLFIIISMAFLFAGVDAVAQDTEHADPRYLELDEQFNGYFIITFILDCFQGSLEIRLP